MDSGQRKKKVRITPWWLSKHRHGCFLLYHHGMQRLGTLRVPAHCCEKHFWSLLSLLKCSLLVQSLGNPAPVALKGPSYAEAVGTLAGQQFQLSSPESLATDGQHPLATTGMLRPCHTLTATCDKLQVRSSSWAPLTTELHKSTTHCCKAQKVSHSRG